MPFKYRKRKEYNLHFFIYGPNLTIFCILFHFIVIKYHIKTKKRQKKKTKNKQTKKVIFGNGYDFYIKKTQQI
jgi:hypothetical protein